MLLIRSLVFNVLFYGMTAVMVVVGLPLLLLPQRVVIVYANIWAWGLRLLLKIVGISHRISGPMPEGQVIYAAKHQSAWETVILYQEFGNPAPVLKRELLFLPVMGFYFWRMPSVPIDRSAGSKALRMLMVDSRQITADSHSIMIFPQGTRVAPGPPILITAALLLFIRQRVCRLCRWRSIPGYAGRGQLSSSGPG